MKRGFILFCIFSIVLAMGSYSVSLSMELTPDAVLNQLREGNERYLAGTPLHPNSTPERRKETAEKGQFPVATILTCSDSRVPPEIIFDRGVGDLFVVKVAGNVADVDEIGTVEYGTDHLHTPVLLVLGHTKCGAVTAVATGGELHGNIPSLVDNIKPAVEKAQAEYPSKAGKELVPYATKANVFQSLADIIKHSPIVAKLIKSGKLKAVGAIYDIETAQITWLGEHPLQAKLIEETKEPAHGDAEHSEPGFFSSPNLIYMGIFLVISTAVVVVIMFVVLRSKLKPE